VYVYLDLKEEVSWQFTTLHNELFLIFHILVCIVSVIYTSLIYIYIYIYIYICVCVCLCVCVCVWERRSADGSFVGDSEVK